MNAYLQVYVLFLGLWDEKDEFYYDHLRTNSHTSPMKIFSMVGLVPLFSCLVLKEETMKKFPGFYKRTKWFLENRKDLGKTVSLDASVFNNLSHMARGIPVNLREFICDRSPTFQQLNVWDFS